MTQFACICRLPQTLGNVSTCQHPHHVHDTVRRRTIYGTYKLAQDRHITRIKHSKPYTECQTCCNNSDDIRAIANQKYGRNGQSLTDGTCVYSSADIFLHPAIRYNTAKYNDEK